MGAPIFIRNPYIRKLNQNQYIMNKKLSIVLLFSVATLSASAQIMKPHGYPITPVPFTSVRVTDQFWGQRLEASRKVTIPLAFSKCEETGRYDNFVKAAHPSDTNKVPGYPFDDTDVYKTIEGAAYSIQTFPNKKLEHYIDSVIVLMGKAQEADGYLYTARTMNPKHPHEWSGTQRFEKVEDLSHEFYNLGHMIEGAVAYYQATGKRAYLDIAIRYADCVDRAIGDGPNQVVRVPGHQIAEMALCKLYLVTGEKRYLNLAKFFLDKRGNTEHKDAYMNYRLFLLHGDSKYFDVLERTLYNGLISGVSLDGGGFFYPNPLESMGQHQRQPWFGCACCPSNICRFIPSLPGYVYAVKNRSVYVNLFLSNKSTLKVDGKDVSLAQSTQYPWNGDVNITVDANRAGKFAMKVRIPGWVRNQVVPSDLYEYTDGKRLGYTVTVNGKAVKEASITDDGYYTIMRNWKRGDKVAVHFDMQPRTVRANGKVNADKGMVSVERGPIVYCAEWPDNNFDIMSTLINQNPKFDVVERKDLLCGINELKTDAQTLAFDKAGKLTAKDVQLTMIPYYAWCHRGSGKMRVWMSQDLSATTPAQPATLASESKVTASTPTPALSAINDRLIPKDENDRSVPYYHWWPKNATTEWLAYELPAASAVQSATVFWYDDGPWGGCRVPKSWKIYYKNANGEWMPVSNADKYGVQKGTANTVNFDPVTTTAVKLEVVLPDDNSAGLFEWSVK
jgi:DUF1680 family protein